jgi:hypothetical protein|tara:strand:- start:323 stop:529 length:207 start_codon:yes stop_codon:yes gene_type:complete
MLSKMFCKMKKSLKEYREWQLKFYSRAEDTLEQRLAGIKAAKGKLEEQMERDATVRLHKDIKESSVEE